MIDISAILKNIMKEYSLNEKILSKATNCNYENISNWCNRIGEPNIEMLEHILGCFGYELDMHIIKKSSKKIANKNFFNFF